LHPRRLLPGSRRLRPESRAGHDRPRCRRRLRSAAAAGRRTPRARRTRVALPPAHLGDVFLSASTDAGTLDFSAVDVHGSTLWQAKRPSGCTGFTVSTDADGSPLAVLTDSDSSTDCDEDVTASA